MILHTSAPQPVMTPEPLLLILILAVLQHTSAQRWHQQQRKEPVRNDFKLELWTCHQEKVLLLCHLSVVSCTLSVVWQSWKNLDWIHSYRGGMVLYWEDGGNWVLADMFLSFSRPTKHVYMARAKEYEQTLKYKRFLRISSQHWQTLLSRLISNWHKEI